MQQFNITQNSTLPYLEMELIQDGRNDFNKAYMALQSADVTFNMTDEKNNVRKIVNAKAHVVPIEDNGCVEKVMIQYRWDKRDTREKGSFKGSFRIIFNGGIALDGQSFPSGELNVPIADELVINVL